jgi:lysophospholipase L1-like esterase
MLRFRAIGRWATLIGLAGCVAAATPSTREDALRYVALGDSYTIGTSVAAAESWPSQLVARVPELRLVANLGVNGYTSGDVIDDELPALAALEPEFVTLLIGVNDVVQGVSEAVYAANVETILDAVLEVVPVNRIACVATPDYTVTPQGAAFGSPGQQRAGIERVNDILRDACERRGVQFVPQIFAVSQDAATDRSLVAGDGLHPSGAQYALWVDAIQPAVEELLLPSADR